MSPRSTASCEVVRKVSADRKRHLCICKQAGSAVIVVKSLSYRVESDSGRFESTDNSQVVFGLPAALLSPHKSQGMVLADL